MKKNSNYKNNLYLLSKISNKLEELCKEVVFVGGCTTGLFITNPAAPDVRYTEDVDCIVDVISIPQYYQFVEKLQKKGFTQTAEDEVICRWRLQEIILDVMPTQDNIFGFTNRWYKPAINQSQIIPLNSNKKIKTITAPYFLATKLEAFKTRGHSDYLASHDFEDIVTVIDGRKEIVDEIAQAERTVQNFIAQEFQNFIGDNYFYDALPGHLNYSDIIDTRVDLVFDRFSKIAKLR